MAKKPFPKNNNLLWTQSSTLTKIQFLGKKKFQLKKKFLLFSKKSIFRLFQKKSQILIFFQHLVQKIEKYIKLHVLGDFGDISKKRFFE